MIKTDGSHETAASVRALPQRSLQPSAKRCPRCNQIETDYRNIFCTSDGSLLVEDNDFRSEGAATLIKSGYQPPGNYGETVRIAFEPPLEFTLLSEEAVTPPTASTHRQQLLPARTARVLGGKARLIAVVAATAVVITVAAGAYYSFLNQSNASIDSVAVLPFLNVNGDQSLEYLSDGMTETLINSLSQLPTLSVKARSSVFRYKGKEISLQAVGSELKVQAILNGRVVQRGDLLALSLELVDARTENIIWSKQYDRKNDDLISLQSEIAHDVSSKLRVKLSGAEEQRLAKSYTVNVEAYQLYLKGRFHWNKRTVKDLEKAIDYFNQAIALDPNYALAHAGLADVYVVLPLYRKVPLQEEAGKALQAATKALSLDGSLVEAHTALALVKFYEDDFAGAERAAKRSIELNSNYATAHHWYAVMLFYLGRHDEAREEMKRALAIDPLSLMINVSYGDSMFYARRYDDAITQLKKTLELDAGFAPAHHSLANLYLAKGSYREFIQEYSKYQELSGEQPTAAKTRESFAKGGWSGFLRTMTGEQRPANLSRYELVVFLAALGEKEKAFAELSKSYKTFGRQLKVDPLLDPLRGDPRFAVLERSIGF